MFYLHDHLDSGQRGRDVLGVRRSHRDRYATGVKTTVKRHDEVDTWKRREVEDEVRGENFRRKGEEGGER